MSIIPYKTIVYLSFIYIGAGKHTQKKDKKTTITLILFSDHQINLNIDTKTLVNISGLSSYFSISPHPCTKIYCFWSDNTFIVVSTLASEESCYN